MGTGTFTFPTSTVPSMPTSYTIPNGSVSPAYPQMGTGTFTFPTSTGPSMPMSSCTPAKVLSVSPALPQGAPAPAFVTTAAPSTTPAGFMSLPAPGMVPMPPMPAMGLPTFSTGAIASSKDPFPEARRPPADLSWQTGAFNFQKPTHLLSGVLEGVEEEEEYEEGFDEHEEEEELESGEDMSRASVPAQMTEDLASTPSTNNIAQGFPSFLGYQTTVPEQPAAIPEAKNAANAQKAKVKRKMRFCC